MLFRVGRPFFGGRDFPGLAFVVSLTTYTLTILKCQRNRCLLVLKNSEKIPFWWSSINAITDRHCRLQCSKESLLIQFRNLLPITHNDEIAFFVRSLGIAFALDGMPVVFRIVSSQTSQ